MIIDEFLARYLIKLRTGKFDVQMKLSRLLFSMLFSAVLFGCTDTGIKTNRKIQRIHNDLFTVDAHSASAINFLYKKNFDPARLNDFGSFDYPRMEQGGLDACFFAIFPGKNIKGESNIDITFKRIEKTVDAIANSIADNPDIVEAALHPDDGYRIVKEGRKAIYMGVESGLAINTVEMVKEYFDMGIRYMTLCFNKNSLLCDSSTDPKGAEHNGVSQLGMDVIEEMNRLGMMVDVSNVSDKSFNDILEHSKAPVIVSHSACRALCSNHRNISDEMLLRLKGNGGVVNITLLSQLLKSPGIDNNSVQQKLSDLKEKYKDLIKADPARYGDEYNIERERIVKESGQNASVADLVDHIEHVIQVIGIDYVGISSDFDGGGGVDGCKDVTEIENITRELILRGYSRSEIKKIWGGNFMRVFREVAKVAERN